MNMNRILKSSLNLVKDTPKTVLPQMIYWVPLSIIYLLLSFYAKDVAKNISFANTGMDEILFGLFSVMWDASQGYWAWLLLAVLLMVLVSAFVRACYPEIARQYVEGKKPSVSKALEVSKGSFLSLLATQIVFGLSLGIAIGFALLIGIYLPYIGGFLSGIALLALVFYAVPVGMVLEPVVVLEKKRLVEAIRRSYAVVNKDKLNAWLVLIVLIIIVWAYTGIVSIIDGFASGVVGSYSIALTLVAVLFSNAFSLLVGNFFYFDITRKGSKSSK